jgi:hypothetical protein
MTIQWKNLITEHKPITYKTEKNAPKTGQSSQLYDITKKNEKVFGIQTCSFGFNLVN